MAPLLNVPQIIALVLLAALVVGVGLWRGRGKGGLRSVAPLFVLAAFCAAFFWRVLFTAAIMPIGGGDLASFFYPIYSFIHSSVQAGQFPLWNPYTFGGMPLAADVQSGMFYPPNLLSWLLPDYGYGTLEWMLIGHYFWAALGAYLWLRAVRLRRVPALAGAGAFAFSGFMAAHFGHMPMIFVAAWLPWHLLLARRTVVRRRWVWPILAGLALGIAFLAGHPQTFLYEILAVALYWVFLLARLAQLPTRWTGALAERGRRLGDYGWLLAPLLRGTLSLVILIGLAAVQLLPASELAGQSLRAAISFEQAGEHDLQPVGLLGLILPRVFGANPQDYWVSWQSTENWGYLGAVTLLLAALGLVLARRRATGFLVALGVLALLVMVGPFSVVFGWIHGLLPAFDRFRAPGRMLLLLSLAVAGLAALGLDNLWRSLIARARQKPAADTLRWTLYAITAAVALLVLIAVPFFNAIFISSYSLERAQRVLNDVNMLAVWLLLALGLLWAAYRRRLKVAGAIMLLGGLMLVELFSATASFNPTSANILAGYYQPAALAAIQKRLASPADGRMDSDTGIENLWQPLLGTLNGIPDTGGLYNPLELQRYSDFWGAVKQNRDNAVYDMLNIRFLITVSPTLATGAKWQEIYRGGDNIRVYENQNAFPRVFLVHDAVIEPDDHEALGKLLNGTYLPWHTVVLPGGQEQRNDSKSTVEKNPAESAAMLTYSSDSFTAHVKAAAPGWAVFSEIWYPGWQATVDGQPAPVLRANVTLRAVAVPAGDHTVAMRFQPAPLFTGALISGFTLALALIALIVVALMGVRSRRPKATI